jgi:DNA-binding PadR family transcriptional regulator
VPAANEPTLSLAEWLVLCLVCEQPRHGFALARLLGADGSVGRIWRVPKPVVYRALQRLEHLELVTQGLPERTTMGPARAAVDATDVGRGLASQWLTRPASHTRDVRSELLVKLALLDRSGRDPGPLLVAQRERLVPVARALRARLASEVGFERTITLWRTETIEASLRFLDAMRPSNAADADRTAG